MYHPDFLWVMFFLSGFPLECTDPSWFSVVSSGYPVNENHGESCNLSFGTGCGLMSACKHMTGCDLVSARQLKFGDAQRKCFGADVPELDLRLCVKALAGEADDRPLTKTPVSYALADAKHLATDRHTR